MLFQLCSAEKEFSNKFRRRFSTLRTDGNLNLSILQVIFSKFRVCTIKNQKFMSCWTRFVVLKWFFSGSSYTHEPRRELSLSLQLEKSHLNLTIKFYWLFILKVHLSLWIGLIHQSISEDRSQFPPEVRSTQAEITNTNWPERRESIWIPLW